MGQTKRTGKQRGGTTKQAAPKGGGPAKKATKAPVIAKGLATQAASSSGTAVEEAREVASMAVAEVEAEGGEAEGEVALQGEAEAEGEGAETASVEASPPSVTATPVTGTPEASSPVVEATPVVAEDPISRAKAAALGKGMPNRKVEKITSTAIAEFILAQLESEDFLKLTPTQITTMSAELSPEQAKAEAKEAQDKAWAAAEVTQRERQAEFTAEVVIQAEEAAARCDEHGLTFTPTMRSDLDKAFVVDPNALKSMAPRTFTKRKTEAVAAWREQLRVHMITARYNQLKTTTAPPKDGPQPKGENLATLDKLVLKALFDAAIKTKAMGVLEFEASGDGSLVAQRNPTIDQWVKHLGLKYYPDMVSAGSFGGMGMHVTASQGTSFGATLPVIREHTSTQIMKMLFVDGVDEMARVHISMETPAIDGVGYKNPHRYWAKAAAVLNYNDRGRSYPRYDTSKYSASDIDTALKGAMTSLEASVERKVVDAMDKDGNI